MLFVCVCVIIGMNELLIGVADVQGNVVSKDWRVLAYPYTKVLLKFYKLYLIKLCKFYFRFVSFLFYLIVSDFFPCIQFFNYNEKNAVKIDWTTARVYEVGDHCHK